MRNLLGAVVLGAGGAVVLFGSLLLLVLLGIIVDVACT